MHIAIGHAESISFLMHGGKTAIIRISAATHEDWVPSLTVKYREGLSATDEQHTHNQAKQ